MNKKDIKDERIAALHRKIQSEAFSVLMIALFCSILIQQFVLNAPFAQYAAECICFFAVALYTLLRYLSAGIDLYAEGVHSKSAELICSIAAGAIVTVINGVLNYMEYADKYMKDGIGYFIALLIITFISASLLAYITLYSVRWLNSKRQSAIQHKMDQSENEDSSCK